jgi:hypothetical protein
MLIQWWMSKKGKQSKLFGLIKIVTYTATINMIDHDNFHEIQLCTWSAQGFPTRSFGGKNMQRLE